MQGMYRMHEVSIAVRQSSAEQINKYLASTKLSVHTDLQTFPDDYSSTEILATYYDKTKKDIIVMGGDVLVDCNFLPNMIDMHRTKNATVTVLLKEKPKETNPVHKTKPNFMGLGECGEVLMMSYEGKNESMFELPYDSLFHCGPMTLHTDIIDAHVYIISRWTLNILKDRKRIGKPMKSIKHQFLATLIRYQHESEEQLQLNKVTEYMGTDADLLGEAMEMSSGSRTNQKILVQSYMMGKDSYAVRIKSLFFYLEVNKDIATGTKHYKPMEEKGKGNFISSSAVVSPQTQVGAECVVGANTEIGDRCGIKKSVIGPNCKLEKNVKIANSVIMGNVTIGEGAKITNSIICQDVVIKPNISIENACIDSELVITEDLSARGSFKYKTINDTKTVPI